MSEKTKDMKIEEFVNSEYGIQSNKLSVQDREKLAIYAIAAMEAQGLVAIPREKRKHLELPPKKID